MRTLVHWTCARSPFYATKYKNFYISGSNPSEEQSSPFERELHNGCKGWALLNPPLSIFSMGRVINMSNLDVGLLARKVMQAKEEERPNLLSGKKYLQKVSPLCNVSCLPFQGVLNSTFEGGALRGALRGTSRGIHAR